MYSDEELIASILHKLLRKRLWKAKHTSFDNVRKGFDPKLHKKIDELTKQLIKEGFIIPKPTHYGLEISLNPSKYNEIIANIEKYFGKKY